MSVLGKLAAKIARKDSLALKLALRPDRDELIARNIIRVVSDQEQQETKEAIGAKLIRYRSLVPYFNKCEVQIIVGSEIFIKCENSMIIVGVYPNPEF